ncbi:hypothetical protein OIU76_001421 [Salix suchowensis]|uniref:DUF4408 domain-containing protein n=1 Tax=Salix suchowensis TaxID=1278906 RepID=A0ABQ9CMM9_9ROSI|nr:CYP722 protein [Salix suchowensis]KAJ6306437.1 hypothetical protein OIU78_021701 [Salix suchowensis]KAJ6352202.1 hypothetical protein OIU76_001421 [Salix suchowensis]KAJ6399505.1 hypothetical protein OIU77_020124 [Salix suchowensis]
MPESFEIFDKEKAGKADDMRENNRKRSVYYFLERVGALLVLLWCSFSCFPVITHTASRYLSFLNQKIYAFVLANVFILIVVYLSSTTLSNDNDQRDTPTQTDIYDEYVSFSTSSPQWKTTTAEDRQLVVSSMLEEPAQAEEKNPVREKDTLDEEKQIVCCEKTKDAVNDDEMGKKPVRDLPVLKEEEFFRRTRSEKHGKEKREYLREFRMSETEIGKETLTVVHTSGLNYNTPAAARKSILEMNNEEFRLTIERFIATKKKILREESIAMLSEEKEEYIAINYR